MAQEKTVDLKEKPSLSTTNMELSRLSVSGMITTDSKDWQKALEIIEKNKIPESAVDETEIRILSFHFKSGYFPAKDEMEKGLHLTPERARRIAREAGKIAFGEVLLKKRLNEIEKNEPTSENAVTEKEKAIIERSGLRDEDVQEVKSKVDDALKSANTELLKKDVHGVKGNWAVDEAMGFFDNIIIEQRKNYHSSEGSKPKRIIHNAQLIQTIAASTILVGLPVSVIILTRLIEIPYFTIGAIAAAASAEAAILAGEFHYRRKERKEDKKEKS
jgi:hypothetical protein